MIAHGYGSRERGMSLVEILVAAAIGIVVLGVMSSLYLANRQVFRYQESYSRIQETGRYVSDVLGREFRNAGYYGCGGLTSLTNIIDSNATSWWLNTDRIVWGYDGGAALPTELRSDSTTPVSDSDIFIVKYRAVANDSTLATHDLANNRFTVAINHRYPRGTVLVATDCSRTSVFRMSNTNDDEDGTSVVEYNAGGLGGLDNTTNVLSPIKYATGGFVSPLVSNAYLVLRSDDPAFESGSNPTPDPCPSADAGFVRRVLAVRSLAGSTSSATTPPRPVACDVQSLQLRYGVDNNGDLSADQFLTATALGTDPVLWEKVVSVRVDFLVVNPKAGTVDSDSRYCLDYNGGADPKTCPASLTGASYTYMWPGQGRRSAKVFSTTFNLRNRTS